MSDDREEFLGGSAGNGGGAAGRTFMVQPGRDLQSNWQVDLAEQLEQYLLKICSGEITSSEEDQVLHSVNFAEGRSRGRLWCWFVWRPWFFGEEVKEKKEGGFYGHSWLDEKG